MTINIQTLKSVIILLLSHLCSEVICDNLIGDKLSTLSDNVQFGFCDGSPEPLYLAYLHYEPWPLLMIAGEEVSVLTHVEIFQEIPANSTVSIEMVKTADGVNISIPCSETAFGNIGSCDYGADSFLTNPLFSVFPELFCGSKSEKYATAFPTPRPSPATPPPDMWAELQSNCSATHSQECELPICPGHYGSDWDDPYTFNITEDVILELDWLLSGTFFIRASITESSGTEFACLQFVMEMTQEEEQETTTEREEGDFCDQCLSEYDEVIKGRFLDVEDELMDEQRSFVFNEACAESSEPSCCQQFIGLEVEDNWQSIAECIYTNSTDWDLASLACQYMGSCQHHDIYWGCYEVMSIVATTLTNGVMVDGGRDHLKRCLCPSNRVTMPEPCVDSQVTCEALLEEVTSPVFSSLANWLETSGDTVCSFNGSGFRRISSTLAILVALVNILR